jgi:hypothetical protein
MAGAKRAFAPAALLATLGLLAAGCGGGGGKNGTTEASGTTTSAAAATTTSASAATTTTKASGSPLAKGAYVAKMQAIGQSLSTSLGKLQSATNAKTAATALSAVQTDLRAAADRLDGITPPDRIKSEHDQLVKAVRDFADELGPVITKVKAGKIQALSTVPSLKGLTEIQTAAAAIAAKGYKIGG